MACQGLLRRVLVRQDAPQDNLIVAQLQIVLTKASSMHSVPLAMAAFTLVFSCPLALNAQPYDPAPESLSVMTWNVEWMFDDYLGDNRGKVAREQSAPNRQYWDAKVEAVSTVIATEKPHVVALQEIEDLKTLAAISAVLKKSGLSYRWAFIQGTDTYTEQDVGFLIQNGLVSYRRHEQSQAMFDSQAFYSMSKHLAAELRWSNVSSPLTLMNVHFRATREAEDKRVRQARLARHFLQRPLAAGEDVILLGDTNSEYAAGNTSGDVAAITASPTGPKMVDLLSRLEDPTQSTHLILDKQFDRIYVSESMMSDDPGEDWVFESIRVVVKPVVHGKRDGVEHWAERQTMPLEELDASDHFPVIAVFARK